MYNSDAFGLKVVPDASQHHPHPHPRPHPQTHYPSLLSPNTTESLSRQRVVPLMYNPDAFGFSFKPAPDASQHHPHPHLHPHHHARAHPHPQTQTHYPSLPSPIRRSIVLRNGLSQADLNTKDNDSGDKCTFPYEGDSNSYSSSRSSSIDSIDILEMEIFLKKTYLTQPQLRHESE